MPVKREKHVFFLGGLTILFVMAVFGFTAFGQVKPKPTTIVKLGYEFELRSDSKIMMDQMGESGKVLTLDEPTDGSGGQEGDHEHVGRGNVQVNNPLLDSIQVFKGFRPFVHATQSETSIATFGRTVVATYNSSAGMHLIPNPSGAGLVYDRIQLSGFSTSTDGGKTFKSGFFPGVDNVPFSYGDPSVDVDRNGKFYYAQLGQDAAGNFGITANTSKSSEDDVTWHNAVVVALDNGADKEWLAVGPDPIQKDRDNAYITWSSFQPNGIELRFAKSTDGGVTWSSKTIFAPAADPDPTRPQNALSFSNPVVDKSTGRLYVPFLHFSNADSDFIQMIISDDGGTTFRFATFNFQPDKTLLPIVQPGELTECGATLVAPQTLAVNLRLTLHAGPDVGGSATGLRRFVNATRLIAQPAIAARNGSVYLSWNTSTSPFFGDQNGTSKIMFMRSDDGGSTWTNPTQVSSIGDPHHVHPSLTIGDSEEDDNASVHITYYTQHNNGSLDLVMSSSNDGGRHFFADRTVEISSTPFALPPTNIPIPTKSNPFGTTNYDRGIAQCYALGEYQSVTERDGQEYVLWGDTRKTITEPVNVLDPLSGITHPQEDVFFQVVKND